MSCLLNWKTNTYTRDNVMKTKQNVPEQKTCRAQSRTTLTVHLIDHDCWKRVPGWQVDHRLLSEWWAVHRRQGHGCMQVEDGNGVSTNGHNHQIIQAKCLFTISIGTDCGKSGGSQKKACQAHDNILCHWNWLVFCYCIVASAPSYNTILILRYS